MKKIGITGGIGSGKTTVCKVFETLGVPVFYADHVSKNIVNEDISIINKIKDQFGANVYDFGTLDRKKMAEIVFNNSDKLNQLNDIIHPAVGLAFDNFCELHKNKPYILKEAAIIFEIGLDKNFDKVIVVTAPSEDRIKRVIQRDNVSRIDIENRMKNQLSDDIKVRQADFVIDNSGNELVITQVLKIHDDILK